MTKFDAILRDVPSLTPSELQALLTAILDRFMRDQAADDIATGQRGLAALTESTREEDWSAYYPAALRNGQDAAP